MLFDIATPAVWLFAVDQVKKSGVKREINIDAVNVKWLFAMNQDSSDKAPVDIVVQVQSYYGYQLITLRSPVQVLALHIFHSIIKRYNVPLG